MSTSEAAQVKIYGPVTPDQAEILRSNKWSKSPAKQKILEDINATVGQRSFALVTRPTGETGEQVPDHLVALVPGDMGTEILPGKKVATELNLPTAADAYNQIVVQGQRPPNQ